MSQHSDNAHHPPTLNPRSSSSSFTPSSPSSEHSSQHINDDLTQNSKHILIDRLNALVSQLSIAQELDDGAIDAIHAQIDNIESLAHNEPGQHIHTPLAEPSERSTASSSPEDWREEEENDHFWGLSNSQVRIPTTPTPAPRPKPSPSPSPSSSPKHTTKKPKKPMTTHRASELAQQAEDLASTLTATITALQARREESIHIHDLLLTRVEAATSRILVLESLLSQSQSALEQAESVLEQTTSDFQSELRYLRIQLQAIEAQSIPAYQDTELRESIRSWKMEWEEVGKRERGLSGARTGEYVVEGGLGARSIGGGSRVSLLRSPTGGGRNVSSSVRSP